MQEQSIEVNVNTRILKPVSEVFEAVVDPSLLSQYFTSKSSGPLKSGTSVEWEFADVGAKGNVDVVEVKENTEIILEWSAAAEKTRCTMKFSAEDANTTVLTITESKFSMDENGVHRAMGQTAGWTFFLACLKAFVQFDVRLRTGLNKKLTDVSASR